jgi:hypothetical protein
MISVKSLFRILDRYGGYPNPRLQQICKFSGFDSGELLKNMVEEFGYVKTRDIISDGLKKSFTKKTLRLEDSENLAEGFLEIKFEKSKLKKNSYGPEFFLEYSYGDSKIPYLDPETEEQGYKEIEDIISDDPYGGIEGDIEQYVIRPFFIENYGFEPVFELKN